MRRPLAPCGRPCQPNLAPTASSDQPGSLSTPATAAVAGYFSDILVGAICARVEPAEGSTFKVYIMTIGVLAPYRRLGIGALLPRPPPPLRHNAATAAAAAATPVAAAAAAAAAAVLPLPPRSRGHRRHAHAHAHARPLSRAPPPLPAPLRRQAAARGAHEDVHVAGELRRGLPSRAGATATASGAGCARP